MSLERSLGGVPVFRGSISSQGTPKKTVTAEMMNMRSEAKRLKGYVLWATGSAILVAVAGTMLVCRFIIGVSLINPMHSLYLALIGLGWLATSLTGIFVGRVPHD